MSWLEHFRKKGEIEGSLLIQNMPPHEALDVSLGFTRVATKTSPFPADDPGAPFHKRDLVLHIKKAADPEVQPFAFRTSQPVGHYYLVLRVMMARPLRGKMFIQIENFELSNSPLEIREGLTVQIKDSLTWPSTPDEELHIYGSLDDLIRPSK